MVALSILAVILVVIFIGGSVWMISTLLFEKEYGIALIGTFIVLLVTICVLLGAAQAEVSANSPKIELNKSEWSCQQTVTRQSTTYVLTGKVMVPFTSEYQDCVLYKKGY